MLSMGRDTFRRFLGERLDFPRPLFFGAPERVKRRGDRLRWRKDEVMAWVMRQPAATPDEIK